MPPQKISIIIPAYNCEKMIGRCLHAALVTASAYRNRGSSSFGGEAGFVEIIVVDDGSTDKTKDEITKYPTIKYLFQQNAGPAAARNLGARTARGDILFFTDSDCLVHSDWIEMILPHFEKPNIAVVAGSYGIANPEKRLSLAVYREILYRHMRLMPDYPSYFGSFNFAIRREVFLDVGGFDDGYRHASGEDNDLSYKLSSSGYKIYFAKDAVVDHYHPEILKEYLRQQNRHGYWRMRMYRDHPAMIKGDGYTFWKDSAEVGLVILIYLSFALIFLGFFQYAIWLLVFSFCALLGINIFYGIKIMGNFKDGLFFGDVMVLRAFARSNGFLAGFHILIKKKVAAKRRTGYFSDI